MKTKVGLDLILMIDTLPAVAVCNLSKKEAANGRGESTFCLLFCSRRFAALPPLLKYNAFSISSSTNLTRPHDLRTCGACSRSGGSTRPVVLAWPVPTWNIPWTPGQGHATMHLCQLLQSPAAGDARSSGGSRPEAVRVLLDRALLRDRHCMPTPGRGSRQGSCFWCTTATAELNCMHCPAGSGRSPNKSTLVHTGTGGKWPAATPCRGAVRVRVRVTRHSISASASASASAHAPAPRFLGKATPLPPTIRTPFPFRGGKNIVGDLTSPSSHTSACVRACSQVY